MKASFSVTAFAAVAAAVPTTNNLKQIRQAAPTITDSNILNYTLTLEHLKDKFYRKGLTNFTKGDFTLAGFNSTFYSNLKVVSSDKTTYITFLTTALAKASAQPITKYIYSFSITNIKSFITTTSILKGVNISAYLSAVADIISAAYLTAAGSILTIEACYSSYLRATLGESPFPTPFDTPLSLNEVYTLASPFIVSCPTSNVKLPVKAFPKLVSDPKNGNITAGSTITLLTPNSIVKAADSSSQIYAAFITVTGPIFAPATAVAGGLTVTVPTAPTGDAPISGQTYVVLTGCNTTVTDDTVAAGPAVFEVGPL